MQSSMSVSERNGYTKSMDEVNKYLEKLPETQRRELERIRAEVKRMVPEAVEVISYGMPAFKYEGKYLVGYAAFKDHLSFFPTPGPIETLSNELTEFELSKGTIQFTLERPLSDAMVQKLVTERLREITS